LNDSSNRWLIWLSLDSINERSDRQETSLNDANRCAEASGESSLAPASNSGGFTLVEAVIAMLVSVVGLVALVGTFAIAMKTNSTSQNLTTATSLAQDRLEQLETIAFQRLADPSRMVANPNSKGSNDVLIAGSLDTNVTASDGTYYYDKIVLAGPNDKEPEGTITVVKPDGTAETRRPDGTVYQSNPFPADRTSYSRRWVILSSNEPDPVDRRLTIAVRVTNERIQAAGPPERVDLYTVLSNK
jgi:type II secretory pathway pseudopilin PulG